MGRRMGRMNLKFKLFTMLDWPQIDELPAANGPHDSAAEVALPSCVDLGREIVRDAFAACALALSFPSLDRLKEAKCRQLETLFASSSSASRDAVLRHAERVLFQGLSAGIECDAYDGAFLQSYNIWAAKLLAFLRFSSAPLSQALIVFDRNSASLEFEFEHGVEQIFGTVQQEAIHQILFFLMQNQSAASQDPDIIPYFLADYFDNQFLPLFKSLPESAFSYANRLKPRWFEWCGKVVPLIYDWIDGRSENDVDVLRGRLQLSLVL